MRKPNQRRHHVLAILSLAIFLCSGCSGLKYHPIWKHALGGAVVGLIIGHQSDEDGAGAALGAAVFAGGETLRQLDQQSKKDLEEAAEAVAQEASASTARPSEPESNSP